MMKIHRVSFALRFCAFSYIVLVVTGCSQLAPTPSANSLTDASDHQSLHLSTKTDTTDTHTPAATSEDAVADVLAFDPMCQVTAEQWLEFPPVDYTNLWNRVRAGYQLTYTDNARINSQLTWYAKNQSYFDRVTERASRYLHSIVGKIEERDMPMELALLPIVESAFDPFAYSPGRASGMWQFIPGTGRRYGLAQNFWYDGRRDVEASTDAALDYLSDLHKHFDGDWLLALAAYNTGEGNVKKAIRRNQAAGKPTDFWSLDLPRETEAYVPQLIAVSKIVANPDAFNLTLTPIPNHPYYHIVDIESQIDLARAAEMAELEMDDLYLLNPGFNKWATDPSGPHRLLLPVDKAEVFSKKLQELPREQRVQWQSYTIKNGDSLLKIANQFNTSVATLKQVNNIRGNTIRAGKTMLIPTASAEGEHYAYSDEQRLERIQSTPREGRQKVTYTVKPGDSFWKIAQLYSVNANNVAKWNGLAPRDKLQIGQNLVIWIEDGGKQSAAAKTEATATVASMPKNTEVIRKVNYKVRNGDSLARIASKFNLTVNQIANWNASIAKNKYIHPGQLLTLWIDVTESSL